MVEDRSQKSRLSGQKTKLGGLSLSSDPPRTTKMKALFRLWSNRNKDFFKRWRPSKTHRKFYKAIHDQLKWIASAVLCLDTISLIQSLYAQLEPLALTS